MPKDDNLLELLGGSNSPTVTTTFYDGEVELYYNDELHAYYVLDEDGNKILVPGVTTITGMVDKSGPLTWWAAGQAVLEMASQIYGSDPEAYEQVVAAYYAAKEKRERPSFDPISTMYVSSVEFGEAMNAGRCAHRKIVKDASDIGHEVHSWLEGLVKKAIDDSSVVTQELVAKYTAAVPIPDSDRAKSCCGAAVEWLINVKFTPILSESKVMSREHNFAGTLDWLARVTINDKELLVLGDFKTSNSLHNEYRMQLSAYRAALTEEHPEYSDIEGLILLRLGKEDGSFEAKFIPGEDYEADLNGFLGALATYNWFKQLEIIEKANKPKRVRKSVKGKPIVITRQDKVAA